VSDEPAGGDGDGDVLVVAEHRRGDLREVSFELVAAGRELAGVTGGSLHVAVIGGNVERFGHALSVEGVWTVHTVAVGEEFNHDVTVQAVTALTAALDARFVLAPHSVNGLDYAPALATRLGVALVPDVVAFSYDDEAGLTATRELYGSRVAATVSVAPDRAVVTVREGWWPPATTVDQVPVEPFEAAVEASAVGSRVTGFVETSTDGVDLRDADVLVGVGRGIGDEEGLAAVEPLVDLLGAELVGTRPVIERGWLPPSRESGTFGRAVAPDLYVALGISGTAEHGVEVRKAKTVVAINHDRRAPVFRVADYGIVGDVREVVPALVGALAAANRDDENSG
jgi:electron transfer flavoprotein alpha subunit